MTDMTTRDAEQDVIRAARAIADSFTDPRGEFISDDLTLGEWLQLRQALDRLDRTLDRTRAAAECPGLAD